MGWRYAVKATTTGVALASCAAAFTTAGSAAPATFPGPNGKIAVGVVRPGAEQGIDLVNPDGSGRTRISTEGGTGPVWSADGRWLAYSSWPEPWVIRVVRADGTSDRMVLPKTAGAPATHYAYAWSPSGAEIAYKCAVGLCAVRVADGVTRTILENPTPFDFGSYPAWSPAGARIAFHCAGLLCIVNADGSDAVVYTSESGLLGRFPDWSPDAKHLLLTSRGRVTTLAVDSGELRLLADLGGQQNARAHWSPDGKSVLIWHSTGVYLLGLDGSQPVLAPGGVFGDWGTSPAVMVSDARFDARWVLSRQAGRVVLSGTASHASSLTVTIRRAGRTYPSSAVPVAAGPYTTSVALPAELSPGTYDVVVGGTSGSERLLDVTRSESLAAPASGLVSRSSVSVSGNGRRLSARFTFSVRPASDRRPTAVWIAPSGAVRLRQQLPNARVVTSLFSGDEPLARGRWKCRLEVGRVPLAVVSVRVD